ncbi:helix-turn-helix transcriptional regulator [Luteibacter jiangsuensis]|uniref:Helix-turn-helix transcriptional regulator n=1 Tax=Luteibacter jiangsuensis TaxID=637577 RepID=A0ABX0PZ25_9GAMM|nr:helix-turn-helix transcriptional regulator [Luteibacter jiangsuensis]NID03555.1 helix-turn-helix transcriptional regulator [Luteibacter jiangsuensis]
MSCVVASNESKPVELAVHANPRSRGALRPRQLIIAQRHLGREVSIHCALMAAVSECGVSRSHFTRAFKVSTGMTPSRWHLQQRMRRALDLLDGPDAIVDIAVTLGFFDQAHFTNAFTRLFRMSPGTYRKRLGE